MATAKIIESYVRYVRRWATIPNTPCKGQYEIDLLAIDPVTYDKYHIESSVSASKGFRRLTAKAYDPGGYKATARRTLGYFRDRRRRQVTALVTASRVRFQGPGV